MVLRPVSSKQAAGTAVAPVIRAVGSTSELEEFAAESLPVLSPPDTIRRQPPFLIWVLAAIVVIEAPFAVLWVRGALAGGPATVEGRFRLESQPSGLAVRVNGQERGQTPLNLPLAAGSYTVDIRQGTGWRSLPVTITAGAEVAQYLEVPPQPVVPAGATGSLQVTTEPPRALITIDGVERGRSPMTIDNLTAGEHQVVLQLAAETRRRTVVVEPGTTVSLIVAGTGTAPVSSGWLAFNTRVPVQIFEGGKLMGSSDVERLMLTAGRHDLDFVSDALGFRARRTVTIQSGEVASVGLDLPNAPLSINAQPWAEVWIDGESVGQTPIGNISRTIGPHEIVFRHPQFGERRVTATVTLKEPARIAVDMRRP